ncbi:hypothetical protein MUY14_43020 [Amycolatopsis sp. FBCC-B4732]|uniref:hypothetical protein n=1 Tax=Amycolatopsis sp. FBCC-B4732 TaxID=3079339 RepID=UPI001FF2BB78|nr:hypothetical protein [Amycolatopsis sp. FBCC-B4732]UOX88385.1 hypothetical protein MUY14_43020 [Amycolatopsis sp. FBCC-B4732]
MDSTERGEENGWPSDVYLQCAEHVEYVRLCRVLNGLRRLSFSDTISPSTGTSVPRDTAKLIDAIKATQWRIGLLAVQLQDGTATSDEEHRVSGQVEELLDLLQSHATDVKTGVIPTPRQFLFTERRSA